MRIGFSCPVLPGHMYPMTTLARKVRERGHEVFFLGIPDAEPMVRVAGFEFYPYGDALFPAGIISSSESRATTRSEYLPGSVSKFARSSAPSAWRKSVISSAPVS